jgi:hypothetical protein
MGRARIRNRGGSGGGTLRSGAPQLLQHSCGASCKRSQRPRAMHSGFKHCTVPPAKFSIVPLVLPVNVSESVLFAFGEWKIIKRDVPELKHSRNATLTCGILLCGG